jgi:hypothetical protein
LFQVEVSSKIQCSSKILGTEMNLWIPSRSFVCVS